MSAPAGSPAQAAAGGVLSQGRSPLAHLLHALNQPLTGLQCSLELALVGVRTPEHYVRTLRDGLRLTERMRALVEAIRELSDLEQQGTEECQTVALETLLQETVDDLRPVGAEREISILLQAGAPLPVWAGRRSLAAVIFRFLDSALSLSAGGSVFRVTTKAEEGQAWVAVRWNDAAGLPEYSPFSRPELGLLIARAGWNRAGAEWAGERAADGPMVTIRMPLAVATEDSTTLQPGVCHEQR